MTNVQKTSYHIATFGCQMNQSDSERLSGHLNKLGFTQAKEEDADLIFINACSVRQAAIDRIWGKLHKYKKIKKKRSGLPYTILTGCILPDDKKQFEEAFDLCFSIKDLAKLPEKLNTLTHVSTLSSPISPNSQSPGAEESYLKIKPRYSNTFSGLVPIMIGCNAFCTYCAVPYTRGREESRDPQDIITEVEKLLKQGYKEITLLGQIINKYIQKVDDELITFIEQLLERHGSSMDNIPELKDETFKEKKLFKFHHLLAVVNEIPGEYWLRFTSSHPKWFSDELIATIARCEKIPNHIHLPVQSGSDSVLKRMLRPYTIEEYKNIISQIKKQIPNAVITTDVIVGFCGETEEEFEKTKELFRWAEFNMAFISQYSTRPGTKADKTMTDNVPHEIKEQRDKELTDILRETSHARSKNLLGKKITALIDSKKERASQTFFHGRTEGQKNIEFPAPTPDSDYIGKFVTIEISETPPWSLSGKVISS